MINRSWHNFIFPLDTHQSERDFRLDLPFFPIPFVDVLMGSLVMLKYARGGEDVACWGDDEMEMKELGGAL